MVTVLKRLFSINPMIFRIAKATQLYTRYLFGMVHEPEFDCFRRLPPLGLFVDVGANVGQSALSFAVVQRRWQIISLEINPELKGWLRAVKRVLGKRFRYEILGVGTPGVHTLYVPKRGKIHFSGEGSIYLKQFDGNEVERRIGGPYELTRQQVTTVAFDDLRLSPQIIKLDVQGNELVALKSMQQTIEKNKPILIVEHCQDTGEYTQYLIDLGYYRYFLDVTSGALRIAGQDATPINYIFVHRQTPEPFRCVVLQ